MCRDSIFCKLLTGWQKPFIYSMVFFFTRIPVVYMPVTFSGWTFAELTRARCLGKPKKMSQKQLRRQQRCARVVIISWSLCELEWKCVSYRWEVCRLSTFYCGNVVIPHDAAHLTEQSYCGEVVSHVGFVAFELMVLIQKEWCIDQQINPPF